MARHYKQNRVSRKGQTPYSIYLRKRAELEKEKFTLSEQMTEKEFMRLYKNAKRAGYTNFMRDVAKSERYATKKDYYRMRREVNNMVEEIINGDNTLEVKEDAKKFRDTYVNITFADMKKWDNEDWITFREDFLAQGGTFEEFRGIYE